MWPAVFCAPPPPPNVLSPSTTMKFEIQVSARENLVFTGAIPERKLIV